MNGLITLVGSGEYLPVMEQVDRFLLANCGAVAALRAWSACRRRPAGRPGRLGRWNQMGEQHFRRLGADVSALPIIDGSARMTAIYRQPGCSRPDLFFRRQPAVPVET